MAMEFNKHLIALYLLFHALTFPSSDKCNWLFFWAQKAKQTTPTVHWSIGNWFELGASAMLDRVGLLLHVSGPQPNTKLNILGPILPFIVMGPRTQIKYPEPEDETVAGGWVRPKIRILYIG